MRVVAIVQARAGSKRLPNKVMAPVGGLPLIEMLISRLSLAKEIDEIVVATSEEKTNLRLVNHVSSLGVSVFAGSENDVLDRYFRTAQQFQADVVVRITGDCPLVDPELVDLAVREFKNSGVEYLSNISPPTFPDGLDVEVFSWRALEHAALNASKNYDREHVTPFIRNMTIAKKNLRNDVDLSGLRWTVDEAEDLHVIREIFDYFSPDTAFSWKEVRDLNINNPQLFETNAGFARNEGGSVNSGQKLWDRAQKLIPGGNMLLSKRAEMFLPDQWPTYFSKAKGCQVWDLDGVKYTDISMMGIGTNTLGYGNSKVDDAVRRVVDAGNMSTLNAPEEVELAERLVTIHPWADMARFARSGGEANAIAVRIARAATGKDGVAICGYHGWHDWYLSTNLTGKENLSEHLLPGLDPAGVPKSLSDTTYPFLYNDFSMLERLVEEHDIGVIKMEVMRNEQPRDGFLSKVRELATARGIVLIFDECTSGFRESFGGLHKLYGVDPDMAVFGKTLGNGYAVTAVIGREEIMQAAQQSFISSTFWTERIGSVAALATLDVMESMESWDLITRAGQRMKDGWNTLAARHGLDIVHAGIPALASFRFSSFDSLAYKTLITQEMLERGYLAGTSFYACTEHSDQIVDSFLEQLDTVFGLIAECEDGRDVNELLKGPVAHDSFKRLN